MIYYQLINNTIFKGRMIHFRPNVLFNREKKVSEIGWIYLLGEDIFSWAKDRFFWLMIREWKVSSEEFAFETVAWWKDFF